MAMWDGSLPKGLVVQAPKNLKPTTTKPPTAKELEALELARQEQAAADLELFIQDFLQRTRTSPEWSAGTVEGKEEMLADWERDVWPGWASQRFGADQATANYTFNAITQALRRDIREQEAQRDTWGNTFQNIGQSVMQGVDQTVDFVGGGIPLAIDSWQTDAADAVYRQRQHEHDTLRANIELLEQIGDPRAEQLRRELDTSAVRVSEAAANLEENRVELAESLANYQSMVEKSERNERERQAVNPQRREDYLRQQELLARDPEAWETLEYIAENPRYLINVLAQQLPNIAVSAAAGGVTGAVARGVAGAAVRSGLSKATQAGIARAVAGSGIVASETTLGVTDATSGIIDEISAIPDDILRNHPAYANLESRGYDTQEIRAMMVAEAVAEAIPSAAMISAVTGIVGPESSLVKPLLGLTSRTGRAANMLREGAVSAVSEFVQEGGTQYAQNVGMEAFYDVATDKTQDVLEAAVTGAVVGGPFGAIGGLAAGQDVGVQRTDTPPTPVPTTATGTPSTTNAAPDATVSTVAGITVPNSISPVIAPGIAENPFYNTGTVERGERRLNITRQMDQTVEAWRDSGTTPANAQELEPIFNLLREYEAAGASDADMAARITAVQAGLGLPETSTLDIATAYAQWLDRGVARPDTVVDLSDIQSDLERVIQDQVTALPKRPSRTSALTPVFNAVSQIESVDATAADRLLIRVQDAVNALPGDKAVDVRKWYKNYKKDPDKYGTGRIAATIGRGSNQTYSGAAADAPAISAEAAPGNFETPAGDSGTVAGAGISRSEYQDAGTAAGDIRDGEPVGGGAVAGTDSGRSGGITLPAGTGTDTGAGSTASQTVERASDDGRAATVDGSEAARTTPITEQDLNLLSPEQLKVYVHTVLMDAGRSVEQASRETVVLLRLLDTVSAFTGETRAQILERVRFGHMGSADRSDSTPSTPEAFTKTVQEAVALDLAVGTVPPDTGERAGNIGVPAPVLGTDLSDPAHYEVREMSDIIPSHDPENGFARRADYPAVAQERPYHSDRGEQEKILNNVQGFNPDFLVNTDPTASNGPPIITQDGIVLGGNSRAMTLQMVYSSNAKRSQAYRDSLIARAEQFGIDPNIISGMRRPVLVRVVEEALTPEEMAVKSRQYNQTTTQKLQAKAEGVSRGRMISQNALDAFAAVADELDTLRKFLDSPKSRSFVRQLIADGVIGQTERSALVDKNGRLNEQGKDLVEAALRGLIISDYDVLNSTPASVLNKLDRSIPALAQLKAREEGWDLSNVLTPALRLIGQADAAGRKIEDYLGQADLLDTDPDKKRPAVQALAITLSNATQKEVAARFALMASRSQRQTKGQMGLLPAREADTPASAFVDAFLKPIVSVSGNTIPNFDPVNNADHADLQWAYDNGGKTHTVSAALGKLDKIITGKKSTAEEKAAAKERVKKLSQYDGPISIYPAKLGPFFRYVPGQILFQKGWHASPSLFNRFDIRYFGSGEGGAHGVGFYFAAQQSVVDEKYINLVLEKQIRRSKAGFRGQKDAVAYRYRVNIPDNLYLIKELEGFSKQDPFVQQVWQTLAEEMGPDSYLARQLALPKDGQKTGRILYLSLARDLNTDVNRFSREGELAASKLLDERGVGGIAYKDQKGNDNFVIFNSDNIEILEVESVSVPVTLKQDATPKTLTDVLVAHLDPDSALGSIEFLSDGTTQILFGDTADASTAIHEFEHLAVNELLKIANDPTIAPTPEKQQLLDDLYALAKYCKVKSPKKNATNPTAWGVDQHERAARAFERYFKEGKAPADSGLDGLFARMKELLTALYERAKILIGHNALPEDVRAAFDRQLTGYFQETVSTSTVNNSELVAQRNEPQVVEVIQAAQSDGSLTMAENNAQGASQEAQAASEAPDAHDLLNPLVLAVEGANFADLERIANNNWTGEELAYIESEAELPNDSVWLPPTPTPLMPTPEVSEQTTPQDELNALVNSFITAVNAQSVQPVAQEITNADGTVSNSLAASFPPEQLPVVSSIATSIVQRAQHLMQQAAQGVHNVRKQINAVATMNYTPVWHATRIAKFITAVKRRMHSGASADFQLWCLENLAPTLGDAYQSPAYQAFINAPNRLEGVKAKLMDDVLTPLYQWAEQAAGQIGRNPAELLQAIGKYRTLLHTLEAAPKQEQELLDAVQAAYNRPPAPNKQRDIAKAEMELFRYREFQSGDPNAPRYKVYGGRSIPECNQELAQLIADYKDAGGAGLLDEGNAYLAQAIDTTVSYLASNGLLSEQDIQGFGQWTHYTPLTIDYSSYEYSGFDIGPCMPKLNFSRYGSIKPAEDGHAALYNLLNRSIRSMGLQDLAQTMLGAYTSLMQRNDPNIEYKSVFGGEIVFANGLAVVPANTLLTLADPTQNKNRDMQSLAEKYLKQSPMWLRLPRTDNDGNTTVTPYVIMFDAETHGNINRAFVHLYANEDPIPILSKLGRVTGGVAQIYTKARPLFPPINAARDIVERLTYLPSKSYRTESGDAISGAKISAQMLLFLANPANLYRIARFQFTGTSGSPYWNAYFNDFAYSGLEGGVDYDRHMIEASRAVINATIDSMKRSGVWQKMSYKARQAFRKTYGTYCHTMYSLPAVAQFVTMRRNKISVRDSAFGTTELMNLRQRGSYHTVLGAFFPFTHSISQTAGNMLHFFGLNPVALSNHPKGRKARQKAMWNWGVLAATIMGMKTLIPLIAASLANEDDEEGYNTLDSIPLGSMQAAIPLGIQGEKPGSYIKIPTGFGPIGLGAQFAIGWDRVERGRMSPHDFVFSTLLSISKTLIPNSAPAYEFEENPAAFVVSTFAPFLVQPIVQSATNTAYSGATIDYYIRPEQRASDMARPTTPEVWRELATTIYDATGGAVDVTPESVRHLVTGYCGGALQIIPAILEGDSVYGNPLHESVRQALGPLPSALGASIVYNPQMQVEQTMFYNAMDYYNDRIKSAGIYTQFTQNRPPKWAVIDWRAEVMRRAGFTPEEISDYTLLYNATQKELKNLNDDLKKQVGPLIGNNDKSEDEIRAAYLRWASDRQTVISGVLSRLYYYQKDYQPEYRAPDERSVQMLRSNAF